MELGVFLFTLGAYGLAGWLWWREETPNYLVALVAGHLGSLPSPLWQLLYQFSYDPNWAPLFTLFERPLPFVIFMAAWTMMLPPLVVFFLYKHRWWFPGYAPGILTFVLFVIYHLIIENIGLRGGWWIYRGADTLPLGLRVTFLSALMSGLISLGLLSLLILTRRYAWVSLLVILLPMPLVLSLFVHGLLGAPLYTALLLRAQSWAGAIGMLGTLGLLLWGAHIVAGSIEGQKMGKQFV
jgi:hypothetical protein